MPNKAEESSSDNTKPFKKRIKVAKKSDDTEPSKKRSTVAKKNDDTQPSQKSYSSKEKRQYRTVKKEKKVLRKMMMKMNLALKNLILTKILVMSQLKTMQIQLIDALMKQ